MAMLEVERLGAIGYATALARQRQAVELRRRGCSGDRLLLLEHPPVITLGRRAKPGNVKTPLAALRRRGIEVHEVSRGGDVTYHGPGQLVGYLIADLEARGACDPGGWLRGIEAALIEALAELGVPARRIPGMTGVFVADRAARAGARPRKIASIGIALAGWISYHGFALNATLDLAAFEDIIPCGLAGVTMTSVAQELGVTPDAALFEHSAKCVELAFLRSFG